MKIRMTADSTCDLTPELIRKYDIGIVPLSVIIEGEVFHDGVDVTPRDIFRAVEAGKAVRTAAETFRANPAFSTYEVIMELATGEALVSFLDAKGAPTMVERARILFPLSQIGAITAGQRLDIMNAAPSYIKEYKNYFDRESAYEVLSEVRKVADEQKAAEEQALADEKARIEAEKQAEKDRKAAEKAAKAEEKERKAAEKKKSSGLSRTIFGTLIGAVGASVARSVGNSIGKSITGGSKKSSSSKSTSSKSKSTSSKSKKSDSGGLGDIFGKAAKSATTTATRKITQEILKGLLK